MKSRWVAAGFWWTMFAPGSAQADGVVGLREPNREVWVAVRGLVPEGTTIVGITFYSNDATVFPEVCLVADVGERPLPSPATSLRSVERVTGIPGYVTVSFPPYLAARPQYLWAIVRLPDEQPVRARGSNGGPGIGWRDLPGLAEERSLFSVRGAMTEFTPAFDIALITPRGPLGRVSKVVGETTTVPSVFTVDARSDRNMTASTFSVGLPRAGRLIVDLYAVDGRWLTRLLDEVRSVGMHEVRWAGVDSRGRRVPSGIYLFRVRAGAEERTGKLVLLH